MLVDILLWFDENQMITAAGAVVIFTVTAFVLRSRRGNCGSVGTAGHSTNAASDSASHLDRPAVYETFDPARNHDDARRLIQSIQGDPPHRRVSVAYLLGLFVVAIAMLLLPCVYLAIVGGAAYGVYWHATQNYWIIQSTRGVWAKVFSYIAPLIVGGVVVLFMFKPMFARRQREMEPIALDEKDQPVLFAFIKELCITLGAPTPKKINVTCEANASAGFCRGLWSIFIPGDVVLTLGLPLVRGLDLKQFAGVLAHEFGHFTQGIASRLNLLIRLVNNWFTRVVYVRDSWDVALDDMIETTPGWFGIIFLAAKLAVTISQLILKILMYAGHAISSFLTRQQEYDADRFEAYISGSGAFADTSESITILGISANASEHDLNVGLQKLSLPEDFVELCMYHRSSIPPEVLEQVRQQLKSTKTGLFDTHPCYSDRNRAVEALAMPGIFQPPFAPASVLFRNFEVLSEKTTVQMYEANLGRGNHKRILCPNQDFLEKVTLQIRSAAAVGRI